MELWIILALLLVAVILVIKERKLDKMFPYFVRVSRWGIGIVGGPAWPNQRLGWIQVSNYWCSEAKVPKIGMEINGLPVTHVTVKETGKTTFEVNVILGEEGEANIDVYNAKRKFLLKEIANGAEIDKKDRIMYGLN